MGGAAGGDYGHTAINGFGLKALFIAYGSSYLLKDAGHNGLRKAGNGTPELEFKLSDSTEPKDGWLYYYVRVHQKDKGLAWSSPVWVS